MKSINVLALCDGMSGGQIALTELGVPINQYYASEIDKFAIKQTQHNFPRTIQIGNIENWREWDIDFKSIDLILAGTPCQGFSFAGKQLAFDDPRSRLFFVFVDILNHIRKLNPDVKFLLENVNMKKSHLEVISRYTGVFPVRINSNLVSAQNRDRWYWTNVKIRQVGLFGEVYSDIPQPKDRGILLRDILEKDVDEKYYLSEKAMQLLGNDLIEKSTNNNKSMTIDASYYKGVGIRCGDCRQVVKIGAQDSYIKINKQMKPKKDQDKASCFTAGAHSVGNHSDMDLILQLGRGFNKGGLHQDKTPTLTKNSWEQNNVLVSKERFIPNIISENNLTNTSKDGLILEGNLVGGKWDKTHEQSGRVYSQEGKMQTLSTMGGGNQHPKTIDNYRIRRLTPTECARLQTIPDWYEWIVSDTQIYKQCGNGWTIEVIKHILSQWDLVNESVLTKAI